jgi:hypothetical protein
MKLPNISNPFKSHASTSTARSNSMEGMPLHQRQRELKTNLDSAKTEVGRHNPNALKAKSNGETQVISNLSHKKIADPVAYNRTCIRYENANHELNMFNKTNADGLKAEAKAGPIAQPTPAPRQHPTSLTPGHPDSAPRRQEFHPELFLPTRPETRHNHPTSLIPGHPDSAPRRSALPPELSFETPVSHSQTTPPLSDSSQRRTPAGPRPMPNDNSPAAQLQRARYELRNGGNRVSEPGQE